MRKVFRMLMCTAMLALLLCTSAMAADGVSVKLNGEQLALTDAPQIVNGRTYLPFRAVFTALGFEDDKITFQAEERKVSAVNDELSIAMVIGENKVSVEKDGQTKEIETDAPAFIDANLGRTYVPARFVAEAVGYRVGWNGDTSTVIIDDVDAILAENQETYEILDQYLEYGRKFQEKNYQVDGAYSAEAKLPGQEGEEADSMEMKGGYSMLLAGNTTFDFEMDMQFAGIIDGEDLAALLPGGVDVSMRGDLENGIFYFKSDSLMSLTGQEVKNTWFKVDLAQMIDQLELGEGMNYSQLIALSKQAQSVDAKTYVEETMRAGTDAGQSVKDVLTAFNAILGDSAFTKNGNNYVTTFEQDGAKMEMTLTTANGKVNGYQISMSYAQEGTSMSITASESNDKMEADIALSTAELSMTMEMDGTYTATTEKPAGAPPEDAAVLDLAQALL